MLLEWFQKKTTAKTVTYEIALHLHFTQVLY